ncbi:MAG: PEP/pyruvate-binding domain-containing protein [Candidatus Omnitrophota bacterium]
MMASTGISGLDEIISELKTGDNVVWQIGELDDYRFFTARFVKKALETGNKVVYMRFAGHAALVEPQENVDIYELDAHSGFESFSSEINNIITREGRGVYYVFDCLSALLSAWATDLMIGNFFMVTCPYLFELDTIAYFAILRDCHSFKTVARIRETTQLLIDIYRYEDKYYVHPLKVWNRYSPTMFFPHVKEGDRFLPVTNSVDAAKVFSRISVTRAESARRNLDYWDRLFLEVEDMAGGGGSEKKKKILEELFRLMISRDEKVLMIARENFGLEDMLSIKSRLIGTGFIGGKAVGMLLARKILSKDRSFNWQEIEEMHDSFYIGSDVFYAYIVQNGLWKLRLSQKTKEGYFDTADVLKEKILNGRFPEEVMEKFQQIIEYFGQSPIIVRSSSLLEDAFGNAFAGKYESFFLANQGTPEERLSGFAEAVRKIYASTMNKDALAYRLQRGLDQADEQMALLVQRVSGAYHKNYFFPDMAGVGLSYNPYVWTEKIDPRAGMLRLVFGLGTRAVNRAEGDYARIVAMNAPLLRPQAGIREIGKYSQHDVDLIDVGENRFKAVPLPDIIRENPDLDLGSVATEDTEAALWTGKSSPGDKRWIITFDKFVSAGDFVENMSRILKIIETKYDYPVDIEFTVNFTEGGKFKINLLQCRPFQAGGLGVKIKIPGRIKKADLVFRSKGHFLGGNISKKIDRIIYVDPEKYTGLAIPEKYSIARMIGGINSSIKRGNETAAMLLGPGRWGTTTPSLGVPVSFAEINHIAVLGEIAFTVGNLMPDLSFGTHFFQDLVEAGIFYTALFPDSKDVFLNRRWFSSLPNLTGKILPDFAKYTEVVGVYDVSAEKVRVMSDIISQRVVCLKG